MEADKIYEKLIEISGNIGKLQADVDAIKSDIQTNYITSEEADAAADAKLEKYYQQAKNRQDGIKAELEARIASLEGWRAEQETGKGRAVMAWLTKARDYVIWAAILALIGYGFKFMSGLTALVHVPPTPPM